MSKMGWSLPLVGGLTLCNLAYADMSYQGYTGYLHVPSAETLEAKSISINYTNAMEKRPVIIDGHTFLFGFGLHENLEVVGRISSDTMNDNIFENTDQTRDLSLNAKLQVPYIPKDWFTLAIGAQDFGGEIEYYDAKYIVVSKAMGPVEASVGIGDSSSQIGRLDGPFGALSYRPFSWLEVMSEYDGDDVNAGVRASKGFSLLGYPLEVNASVQLAVGEENSENDQYWGIGFTLPLSRNLASDKEMKRGMESEERADHNVSYSVKAYEQLVENDKGYSTLKAPEFSTPDQVVAALKEKMQRVGLESLAVEVRDKVISVGYENNVFNRNEIDALGLVLGWVSDLGRGIFEQYHITIRNQGIAVIDITGDISEYFAFLDRPCAFYLNKCSDAKQVARTMQVSYASDGDDDWFGGNDNNALWRPRLALSPGLTSALAWEYGVADYAVNFQIHAELPVWKGGTLSTHYGTDALLTSDDYDDDGLFSYRQQESGMRSLLFNQTFKLFPSLYNMTSLGKVRTDYSGVLNETAWLLDQGKHKFSAELGQFEHDDFSRDERDYSVFSYRYYSPSLDASLTLSHGEFWEQETGSTVEMAFNFGDASVSVEYRDAHYQQLGVALSLPLTPRKEMNPTPFGQITGRDNWRYEYYTVINEPRNILAGKQADTLFRNHNLEHNYFNRDRLTPAYISNHMYRMRDIYLTYKN